MDGCWHNTTFCKTCLPLVDAAVLNEFCLDAEESVVFVQGTFKSTDDHRFKKCHFVTCIPDPFQQPFVLVDDEVFYNSDCSETFQRE